MRLPVALENLNYRHYFISSCFATMAVWMMRFLFGWLIWSLTKSFFWVGVASTGLLLPSLIVTPVFGVVSDRINLRTGLIVWLGFQAGVAIVTTIIFIFWQPTLIALLVLTFVFGTGAAAGSPLRFNLIPKLVDHKILPNAVGLGAIIFNSSRILAPALAAWLLTFTTPTIIFSLCVICFIVAQVFVMRLPSLISPSTSAGQSGWQDFKVGLEFSWQSPFIRLLIFVTLINSQVARSLMELLPALSGTFTEGKASDLATLTACAGLGSVIGGWFISRQPGETQHLLKLLMITMMATSAAILPLLFPLNIWPIAVLIGIISLLMTLLGTGSQIVMQIHTDDKVRGRVMGLWLTFAIGGPAIGAFIMGSLAEFAGFTVMLAVMLMLSCFGAYWLNRQRKLIYQTINEAS